MFTLKIGEDEPIIDGCILFKWLEFHTPTTSSFLVFYLEDRDPGREVKLRGFHDSSDRFLSSKLRLTFTDRPLFEESEMHPDLGNETMCFF